MKTQNSDQMPDVDLFGHPVEPLKDPRGRKAWGKSKENQAVVVDLAGQGFSQADIATVLGCDEKTLRKYFSRELANGRVYLRAQAAMVRAAKMRQGNMVATRAILEDAAAAPPSKPKPEPKAPALGKKEILERDAAIAPGGWGDLLNKGRAN